MTVKNFEFKTETKKILHLVTHSLYSNRDIFLRELISNSSDAIDKARIKSLTESKSFEKDVDWKIKIIPDKSFSTLTISDNGIGMTEKEIIEQLGTIAMSGTQAFIEAMSKKKDNQDASEMIGQFGVGFYSAFMVANRIKVISRSFRSAEAVQWESTGEDNFRLEFIDKKNRGTDVILYLNDESKEYLEEFKIKEIVRNYSNYIEFPIVMDVEKEEIPKNKDSSNIEEENIQKFKEKDLKKEKKIKKIEQEILNNQQAIWLKNKSTIKDKEYESFYQHISQDYNKPLTHIHYKIEGTTEFSALIYIPSVKPFALFNREQPKNNIHLYVKRVFILKDSEAILPEYLRFISGVVDSSDLPLNVSRELLQKNKVLQIIKNSLVSKILNSLLDIQKKEAEKYKDFFKQFGSILKEGVYSDNTNQELLLSLLMFKSTKTTGDEYLSFNSYIDRMKENQKEIYYLPGENEKELENISHLEIFKEKDLEVLYFVDPIDEIMLQTVNNYKGKKLKSILKGDVNLDSVEKNEKIEKNDEGKYKSLNDFIKSHLKNEIKEVKLSNRLISSSCCLVGDENSMSSHMEKIMKAYNKNVPKTKRILEINPKHPLIKKIQLLFQKNKSDEHLIEYIELLYDQALISEGSKISNPSKFNQRFSNLMLLNKNLID